MAISSIPIIVLRSDPLLGCYMRLPVEFVAEVTESLTEDRLRFELDPPEAARVAVGGERVFVFGAQHPVGVRQVLEDWEYEVVLDSSVVLPEQSYRPPVEALLSLGEPPGRDMSVDCAALGLGREHIPELIRMAVDPELHSGPQASQIVWAPVHAWRALAALRAEAAIVPLLGLLARLDDDMDDWLAREIPDVCALFGQPALQPAADYLADARHGVWARVTAANCVGHIGVAHPDLRAECVAKLAAQLEQCATQTENFNGMLVWDLMDLKAVEAAPVIERAFAAGRVDESVCGDWENVQIEFGLKTHREHPPKPNSLTKLGEQLRAAAAARELENSLGDGALDLPPTPFVAPPKIGRNEPCPCGSGKKFKKCCGK